MFFHAGQSRTNGVSPLSMFIATAPPRLEPTTTSGWPWSYSAWAMATAASKSSSGRAGFRTVVAVVLEVGRLQAAWGRLPAVEEEDFHIPGFLAMIPTTWSGKAYSP